MLVYVLKFPGLGLEIWDLGGLGLRFPGLGLGI